VSGGPDSLALMLLAHQAIPGQFEVATVDHRLRPESADEAAMVARLCAERGIPHRTLACEIERKGNLQANARAARYAALARWIADRKLAALVTAHHLDDQAETLLMRLNRGAGVRGLAGMRPRATVPGHTEIPLLRPLLGWRKAELGAVVAAAGLSAAQDPSNADPRFERAALRGRLAQAEWLDPAALAASAGHLADADAALAWVAEREWYERVQTTPEGMTYRPSGPRAVRLRVLERILAELGREGHPRGSEVARLHERLHAGRPATLGGVRATTAGGVWTFLPAPPRRSP
jgi:tRNA(Ile)-lysidine synthase